jgi:ornithine decarboxylase
MLQRPVVSDTPAKHLATEAGELPVHFFAPSALDARLQTFKAHFPGVVTYAVKANPADHVVSQLWAGGLDGFDVASPDEIALIQRLCPGAAMHYNNPVRSRSEIRFGIEAGVASWSVDDMGELEKLIACGVPLVNEFAVRFKLPVAGGTYNFGAKFGATEDEAVALLRRVADAGFRPAMTFHVGTQCKDPQAFASYVAAAARIAAEAGVTIERLNVGGGFPAGRDGQPVDLLPFFAAIDKAVGAFDTRPILVCEPGRGMVADSFAYAVQVKSVRSGRVYLNDGVYGGLAEFPSMVVSTYDVVGHSGAARSAARQPMTVFGPTCDSIDQLPGTLTLPVDLSEGDWIIFRSMGAYLTGMTTRFNGYGDWRSVTVNSL